MIAYSRALTKDSCSMNSRVVALYSLVSLSLNETTTVLSTVNACAKSVDSYLSFSFIALNTDDTPFSLCGSGQAFDLFSALRSITSVS